MPLVEVRATNDGCVIRTRRVRDKFEESEHPRAANGEFGSGGGGSSSTSGGGAQEATTSTPPPHAAALKVPPAWKNVQYATSPDAALQVTGTDSKGRKVYIYHPRFAASQAAIKFSRISDLASQYKKVSAQNYVARSSPDSKTRDAADCLYLIIHTGIRPGSESDTKAAAKAYGATTLEGKHVAVDGDNVSLQFVGKKGVSLKLPVTDPEVAQILIDRKAASGDDGKLFGISDAELRAHTKTLDGGGFKTKDFRTLLGTSTAMEEVSKLPVPKNAAEYKKAVMSIAKVVSAKLGNTPVVALQSYISPTVFAQWRMET